MEINNEVSKEVQIQRIIGKLDIPPTLERHSIKVVINYLRQAKKALIQIQREAKYHREKYLQQKKIIKTQ